MAGSYGHVDPDGGGKWSLIENMGDAYECVEELLYLVRAYLHKEDIESALRAFYAFKRGERDPSGPDGESPGGFGRAFLETARVMRGDDEEW